MRIDENNDRTSITFYISGNDKKAIIDIAKTKYLSISNLMRMIVGDYIKDNRKELNEN